MSRNTALRRALALAASCSLVASAMVAATPANAADTPKTGGVLQLLEHEPRLDHLDPLRQSLKDVWLVGINLIEN